MRLDCSNIGDDPSDTVRLAYDHLMKDGYVVLDRAPGDVRTPPEGDGRGRQPMATHRSVELIDLADADPLLYAHPAILGVVREALDTNATLRGLHLEVTLPGAAPQHVERGGLPLFDATLAAMLPAHALSCLMPLAGRACIAVWPRSHRWKERNEDVAPELVALGPGDCLIRDSRLFSGATAGDAANEPARLVAVQATYARRWYRELRPSLQRPAPTLSLRPGFLDGVDAGLRPLFAHVVRVA